MKKSILSVAAAVLAGVAGIFAFTACNEFDWQRCATEPEFKDLCIYECEQNKAYIKQENLTQLKQWCEANGIKVD